MGKRYAAIWKDTRITYPVFYGCTYDVLDRHGWWSDAPPRLFGATDDQAGEIASAMQEILAAFVRRGDARNYSLLTKWLHFCFPDTFAIYDSQAAKSIEAASARLSLAPSPGVGRDQFSYRRISDTSGTGYVDLLNFYRLFWDAARSSGLATGVQHAAEAAQTMLRGQPGCPDAQVSTLDILDKLLWKAEGSYEGLGLDRPCGGAESIEIKAIIETAIYVDDLEAAEAFYRGVLGLEVLGREAGRHVFFRVGDGVLLAFDSEATLKGGVLPPHGAVGPGHFALGVRAKHLDGWRLRLEAQGIVVEKEMTWPRGSRSLYFRDPAGNSVELVTPGLWSLPGGW